MKKLLVIIVLGLFLITPSQADNIRDFQIEGLSINDSLLNFIKKEKIIEKQNYYKDKGYQYLLKDFYSLTFYNKNTSPNFENFHYFPNLKNYDDLQFHFKHGDGSFKIYSIEGGKYFKSMNRCFDKQDEVEIELNELFKNIEPRKNNSRHDSNKAQVRRTEYPFQDGFIRISCQDWDEGTNIKDALVITIAKEELNLFLKKNYK